LADFDEAAPGNRSFFLFPGAAISDRLIQLLNLRISSILLFVNIKRYRSLHYLLIILLMLAPFRSAMANTSPHCDMDAMSASNEINPEISVMPSGEASLHQHAVSDAAAVHHQCCCCDDGNCAGSCDMGMSVSLVMHESLYAPVIVAVTESVTISSSILIRALTPLTRPPATFS
jgi:hypothetical protein